MVDQARLVRLARVLLLGFVAVSLGVFVLRQLRGRATVPAEEASPSAEARHAAPAVEGSRVVVYFFHPSRRCEPCETIEAYASAAIRQGFDQQLREGRLEWRAVDFEAPASAGFVERYGLYTSAVVLVEMRRGEPGRWKNLEDVWLLLGSRQRFVDYVQQETAGFLSEDLVRTTP